MKPISFFSPLLKSTLVITIIFSATLALDPYFEACAPVNCGTGVNITYPFWIPSKQQSYCGLPNFEISCHENEPVLSISNEDYIIRNISYSNNTLLVANAGAYDNKDTCPTPLHNLSLSRTPFNLSSVDARLFFFYNCTKKPPDDYTYSIACASNSTHYAFAGFHVEPLLKANYSLDLCRNSVYVPVDVESGINALRLWETDYVEVLKMGFVLSWNAHNCSICETSGGRCGFKDNKLVCFCSDKPHVETCFHGNSEEHSLICFSTSLFSLVSF